MEGSFDLSAWIDENELESNVVSVLKEEHLLKEKTLLLLCEKDIADLHLPKGDKLLLISAVAKLQAARGGGPCAVAQYRSNVASSRGTEQGTAGRVDDILAQLGALNIGGGGGLGSTKARGEHLRVVDYVPNGTVAEEELSLGDNVTLKLGTKPKLERVSQAMWVVANTRILKELISSGGPNFDTLAYLKYTEMVGEMACRFTWLSVLQFDDDYRKKQAAEDFAWGTELPHLSTVVLRDRPQPTAAQNQRRGGAGQGTNQGQRVKNIGASGREICLQWNRGYCSFGARCNYEHTCTTCGNKGHPAKDHPNNTNTSSGKPSTIISSAQ